MNLMKTQSSHSRLINILENGEARENCASKLDINFCSLLPGTPGRNSVIAILCLLLVLISIGCTKPVGDVGSKASSTETIERIDEKGPVKLVLRLSPKAPRLSDLVDMEIEVTAEADVEIKAPAFGQAVGDFLVRDYSEKSDAKLNLDSKKSKTLNRRHFHYQLEPVHTGQHLIRSIAIEFIDNRSDSENRGKTAVIESDPIEIDVTSELGDKVPSLTDLAPMVPPRPLSQSSAWFWFWLAAPIAAMAAILLWSRRKRKSRIVETVSLSPSEIAHSALAALLSENLPAQKRFQEFYLRLTGIVRRYIEGTTGIHAPDQTTEEFLRAMRSRHLFQAEQSVRLQDFLEAADMVKYAGQEPNTDQIELSIGRAREFVQMRSPIPIPVDKIKVG